MNNNQELWKPVSRNNNYEISTDGRAYSCKRDLIMKPFLDEWGYQRISLHKNGKRNDVSIHRLVAEAFIPNPENKPEVNHKDGNKLNNNVNNLEWCTHSENILHACRTGLNNRLNYDAGKPKRRVMDVESKEIFQSVNECAKTLNCTRGNVISCLKNRTKSCKNRKIIYID